MLSSVFPEMKSVKWFIFVTTVLEKYIRFLLTFRSLVDMSIIIPYYILFQGENMTGVIFFSAFRAFEIFHLFPAVRKEIEQTFMIFILIIYKSSITLLIFGIMATALIIFFGSVFFELEMGTFTVNSSFPNGYMQIYLYGTGGRYLF
jgi:hypothetical protein